MSMQKVSAPVRLTHRDDVIEWECRLPGTLLAGEVDIEDIYVSFDDVQLSQIIHRIEWHMCEAIHESINSGPFDHLTVSLVVEGGDKPSWCTDALLRALAGVQLDAGALSALRAGRSVVVMQIVNPYNEQKLIDAVVDAADETKYEAVKQLMITTAHHSWRGTAADDIMSALDAIRDDHGYLTGHADVLHHGLVEFYNHSAGVYGLPTILPAMSLDYVEVLVRENAKNLSS